MESIMKIMVSFCRLVLGTTYSNLDWWRWNLVYIAIKSIANYKFPYVCSQTFGKMFSKPDTDDPNAVSPFSAAVAALASSIGASNIIGVPVAIAYGGPGAVFG